MQIAPYFWMISSMFITSRNKKVFLPPLCSPQRFEVHARAEVAASPCATHHTSLFCFIRVTFGDPKHDTCTCK